MKNKSKTLSVDKKWIKKIDVNCSLFGEQLWMLSLKDWAGKKIKKKCRYFKNKTMCKGALSRRVGTWRRRVGTYINYQVTISVSIRALISIHIVVEKGRYTCKLSCPQSDIILAVWNWGEDSNLFLWRRQWYPAGRAKGRTEAPSVEVDQVCRLCWCLTPRRRRRRFQQQRRHILRPLWFVVVWVLAAGGGGALKSGRCPVSRFLFQRRRRLVCCSAAMTAGD